MLEVQWEFRGLEEERVVQAAVDKVVRRLQRALASMVCPTHGRSPILRVRGTTLSTLDIDLETCCKALREETSARIHDIRKRGTTRALVKPEVLPPYESNRLRQDLARNSADPATITPSNQPAP
jgi:hypothetical protein